MSCMPHLLTTIFRLGCDFNCEAGETGTYLATGLNRCTFYGTVHFIRCGMAPGTTSRKIPLIFFRSDSGNEPVREWLKALGELERREIGRDLLRAQWRWPASMPLCRPLGDGLWEVRTNLPTKRTARVLICVYREHLVALHGFVKKTRRTPGEDLALARKRQKELE